MGNEKGGGAVRCIYTCTFRFIFLLQLLILLISKSGMEQLFYNPFFFVCKLKKIFAVRKRWEGGGIPLPTLRCFVPLPDKLEEIGWSHLIGFPEFRSWHHVLENCHCVNFHFRCQIWRWFLNICVSGQEGSMVVAIFKAIHLF